MFRIHRRVRPSPRADLPGSMGGTWRSGKSTRASDSLGPAVPERILGPNPGLAFGIHINWLMGLTNPRLLMQCRHPKPPPTPFHLTLGKRLNHPASISSSLKWGGGRLK